MGTTTSRGIARHRGLPTFTSRNFTGASGCCGLNPATASCSRATPAGPRKCMPPRQAGHAAPPSRPATPSGSTLAARNANHC